jgi:Protein of unknown function (DUF2971)
MDESIDLNADLTSTKFSDFQKDSPPDPLYHYTDQAGLLGIIKESELWATKVQYMNDTTEFGRAVELAKSRIQAHVRNSKPQSDAGLLEAIVDNLNRIMDINICSISFCRRPDLLSQWRGYSGSGAGYAIGFVSSALIETARNHSCQLGRCIYEEEMQIGIVDELIGQIIRRSAGYQSMQPTALKNELSLVFTRALIKFGAFFKDAAFAEEEEWRLVSNVKYYWESAFRFRTGKSMLIPYYCLKVGDGTWRNKIAHVMVGPCPHPHAARMAVIGLLLNHHVTTEGWPTLPKPTHPPVDISTIPYRSW